MLRDRELLAHVSKCFDDGEIETLVRSDPAPRSRTQAAVAVMVVHRPTGIEVLCDEHETQIRNKAVALLRLMDRLVGNTNTSVTPKHLDGGHASKADGLAGVIRKLASKHRHKLDKMKGNASLLRREDAVWHLLLGAFATLGGSKGWAGLIGDEDNYARVTFDAIKACPARWRARRIDKTLRVAKVRYPARKAGQLVHNFDIIESMGGPTAARSRMLGCVGREGKIAFLKQFKGIGDKYGRDILMDVYHPDFRDSVALDTRVRSVTARLGLSFVSYEEEERFYLDVARRAGVDGWTVDRVIYNFRDEVMAGLAGAFTA